MKKIIEDSLHVYEAFNGFHLYGRTATHIFDGDDEYMVGDLIHIAAIGTDTDVMISNPNFDHDLPEAYGFEVVGMIAVLANAAV